MDVTNFFTRVISFIGDLFRILDQRAVFTAFGESVSVLNILGALVILSMVISIFWKGAKA